MIVNRRTFHVLPGRMEEAVELLAQEIAAEKGRGGFSGATRICTSSIGQSDRLAVEWEYESLAEYEQGWAEWGARPTSAGFREKWRESVTGGINEIWNLR